MSKPATLPEKVLAVDAALGEIPHAFGGALALAYYAEPRGTADIDVNVFVPEAEAREALRPLLEIGAAAGEHTLERADVEGQTRLVLDGTPIDLFFSYDPFHDAAQRDVRRVPFAGDAIPILAAEHLVVCKVVFDRPRDWVDIEAILEAGTRMRADEVIRWVQRIVGDEDRRYERIVALLTG